MIRLFSLKPLTGILITLAVAFVTYLAVSFALNATDAESSTHPTNVAVPSVCEALSRTETSVCVKLATQETYSYDYQGATVAVPGGSELVRECRAEVPNNADVPNFLVDCLSGWLK